MQDASSKISRRKFIKKGGAALTTLGLTAGFPNILRAIPTSTIKIGVLTPSHCAIPILYANLAGYYREHGLAVEVINVSEMNKLTEGVIKGDLHFGQIMVPMTIAAHTGSGPFAKYKTSLVSPMWVGTNGGAMVVRHDSNIRLPGDLKGKRIGIHSRYLFHYLIMIELFERYGIISSKDVTLKVMGMDSMIKALETNEIDAFINPEPLSSVAVSKGLAKDFILTKDLWFRHPCCCLTTRRTLFENESNLFHDFVTATLKSSLEINDPTSRELKLKMIWKRLPQFQQIPFSVIKSSFTPGRSDFEPFPYQSSAKVVAKLLQKNGLISQNVSVEDIASEIFLSDYTRNLMESIQAAYIPSSNDKEEKVVGRSFN